MTEITFTKGQATRNDFIVFTDLENKLELSAAQVAYLCHRRAGIGGDGILRVVKAGYIPQWSGDPELWFMDYRNSDGSIAEMCGNGLRLFVRYLQQQGLMSGASVDVATRAGLRSGHICDDGQIAVTMGDVAIGEHFRQQVASQSGVLDLPARFVDVGNPHLVSFLPTEVDIADLLLHTEPTTLPDAFAAGVNHEFVQIAGIGELQMRVYERGSGETCSCGTGVVASAALAQQQEWPTLPQIQVRVPGGELRVSFTGNSAQLLGSAELVAHGVVVIPEQI